ncbi:hypothetical protein B0I35DRAFT_443923 [Stachybotrys elegans]|uniref:Zn(2)-C6 fungal-type domain-containing protein n=1 Tax=Stachybotrys elegans TaxID=80388 RepID=A0A8K0SE06_9HYPO|nr:hypothetical protein B0I35DRAFT_443923 [Stachybotrys elegans]
MTRYTARMSTPPKPPRHRCHCGKEFIHRSHLRRHESSHTQASFACHICSRSFVRRDVYTRHLKLHDSGASCREKGQKACDVCRKNKQRCNGDVPCLSCVSKGIACTYPSPTSSKPCSVTAGDDINPSLSPDILSSQRTNLHTPRVKEGLEVIILQIASVHGQILGSEKSIQAWMASSIATYFGRFHERWPIIHAPIFDKGTESALLVGSVILLGSWQRESRQRSQFLVAFHQSMMSQLLPLMKSLALDSDNPQWPYAVYQAAVLNVIFAVEALSQDLISGAVSLLSLVIESFRYHGIFRSEAVDRHQKQLFTSKGLPWLRIGQERWKRLAAAILKIGSIISIIHNKRHLLKEGDVTLSIPATFAMWNSHAYTTFYERLKTEPKDRQGISMDMVIKETPALIPSGTLLEDIELGLAGASISLSQEHAETNAVANRLQYWKASLDRVKSFLCETPNFEEPGSFLLRAYSGNEDKDGKCTQVIARIRSLYLGTLAMHCLLSLRLYSRPIPTGPSLPAPMETSVLQDLQLDISSELRAWAASSTGRHAFSHSMSFLQEARNAATAQQPDSAPDPLIKIAVSHGFAVVSAWFRATDNICLQEGRCAGLNSILDWDDGQDRREWLQKGGNLAVDGCRTCHCSKDKWLSSFQSVYMQLTDEGT